MQSGNKRIFRNFFPGRNITVINFPDREKNYGYVPGLSWSRDCNLNYRILDLLYITGQPIKEIILPEGHIIPPEGSIFLSEGHRRPQGEAAQRRDNATRRWNNVAWGQYNFLWPEGTVVMMTVLYRQYCFSLSQGWQPMDNDCAVFQCPGVVKPLP